MTNWCSSTKRATLITRKRTDQTRVTSEARLKHQKVAIERTLMNPWNPTHQYCMGQTSRLKIEERVIMSLVVTSEINLRWVISWGKKMVPPNLEAKSGAKYQIYSLNCHLESPRWHQVHSLPKQTWIIPFSVGRGRQIWKNMKPMFTKQSSQITKHNYQIIFCENLKKAKKTQFSSKNPLMILTARSRCKISIAELFGYSRRESVCQRFYRVWRFGFWQTSFWSSWVGPFDPPSAKMLTERIMKPKTLLNIQMDFRLSH